MRVAGIAIKDACRPVGVRNVGTAFRPRWVWKCRCGAKGINKTENGASEALDRHVARGNGLGYDL